MRGLMKYNVITNVITNVINDNANIIINDDNK